MLLLIMMFNGLVCVDSDGSDFAKDSGSSCSGVCEQYYRNKLLATLEILKNKEETIRVQGSSLGVAEARIAALTERASALRKELDQKARELEKLRSFAISCKIEKTDVSITAELQEVENQKNVVDTLQDNLAVIAELYRECFYETAKQEEMIDLMRKSYHEVKMMDKEKTDKISRLQNVINRQKLSIEQCQDVVTEVENLKSEISSFMNSSNNDSGMWERGSESPDVGEELGDILDQLRQLQDMLSSDCTCGLQEESNALKEKNESLEMRLEKLKQRMSETENMVSSRKNLQSLVDIEDKERKCDGTCGLQEENKTLNEKNESLEMRLEKLKQRMSDTENMVSSRKNLQSLVDIEDKERKCDCTCGLQEENKALKEKNESLEMRLEELKQKMSEMENMASCTKCCDLQSLGDFEDKERKFQELRLQISELEWVNVEKSASVETLTKQLQQTEVLLRDTTTQLGEERSVRATQEDTTRRLQCRLQRADKRARERLEMLEENAQLKNKMAELEKRLQDAYETCRHLEENCRDQHAQLQEAHARSAELCEESRSITAEMRVHIRRQKELVREQQEKISRQELKISELQCSFDGRHIHSIRTVSNVTDPCCSKILTPCPARTEPTSCPCCTRPHHPSSGSGTTFSPCSLPYPRSMERESDIANCAKCASNRPKRLDRPSGSELASCSSEPTPVPPRRQKKRLPCEDRCAGWFPGGPRGGSPPRFAAAPRVSPTDELLERIGRLHSALADGRRRWTTKTPRR